jgi:endoglucanase
MLELSLELSRINGLAWARGPRAGRGARLATLLVALSLVACSDKQGSENGGEAGDGGSSMAGSSTGGVSGVGGGGRGGTSNAGSSADGNSGAPGGGTAGSGGGGRGGAAGSPTGGSGGGAGSRGALPWLRVTGNRIEDPSGNEVILRGVSFIDLGATEEWEGGARQMIDRLTNTTDTASSSPGWYTRVVRLAIYPPDSEDFDSPNTYQAGNTAYYDTLLRPVVDYARQKGVYAIIDWHYIGDTNAHVQTTSAFWTDMAPRFANDSHVLFELFNEPINDGNWASVRANMQTWYDIVRARAPQNLVLVGTPNWCQIVGPTAQNPVNGTNIAYVAHMYPLHWNEPSLRSEITTAAAVHPVFVSEWGFDQGGNEIVDGTATNYGNPFKQFIEQNRLSWTAWCASSTWGPPMFNMDYSLRVGEGSMGGFVKDWLYEKRDANRPMP